MRSALKSAEKVLGRPLGELPAEPAALAKILAQATPAAAAPKPISDLRWERVRSLLTAALMEYGFGLMPGRDTGGHSPAWRALLEGVPDKRTKIGLSRLLSFFRRECIEPENVDLAAFVSFEQSLTKGSLHAKATKIYRATVRYWNKAVEAAPGWPSCAVPLAADPRLYAMPLEAFPTSFQADLRAFLKSSGNQDPFADDYTQSVRPGTVELRRGQIVQIASALVETGFDIEQVTGLAILTVPANAKAALVWLRARKQAHTTPYLSQQAQLLVTIARHWAKRPEHAEVLRRYASNLTVKRQGMVQKNRLRLMQFDHPENRAALLGLPRRVFDELARRDAGGREEALRAMRALAVDLMIVAPMRADNHVALELERTLISYRRAGKRHWHIVIPENEVKNKVPIEIELPPDTVALLEAYLAKYRGRLNIDGGRLLYPGAEGGRRSTIAFSTMLSKFIKDETGIKMHVHLFRHLAAKLYLDIYPDDLETVRRILGHTTTSTTGRAYAHVRTDHAYRRYDALVAALRAGDYPAMTAGRPLQRGAR